MTKTFVCKSCPGVTDFIHTIAGMVCASCHDVAETVWAELDPVVPFGFTRQLEELDRLYGL